MHKQKMVEATKYLTYVLLLLALYILQTTPAFLQLLGIKPLLLIPAAVCIAIYEGEFAGGLLGAFAGLLCDLASYTISGFYAIFLLIICTGVGLSILYLMKQNRLNAVLLCGGTMLGLGLLEHFFYFAIWGYENTWLLLWQKIFPRVIYSLLFVPLFYWGIGKIHQFFAQKLSV